MSEYTRSYTLNVTANSGKQGLVDDLLSVWLSAMAACKHDKIRHLKSGGKLRWFKKHEWTIGKPPGLSARQFKSVEAQVDGALKSWQERATIEGRKLIYGLAQKHGLTDEQRHALFSLNVRKQWWTVIDGDCLVDSVRLELIDLILKRQPWPVFTKKTAVISNLVCSHSKDTVNRWWIDMVVLDGHHIYLPVDDNPYLDKALNQGTQRSVTTVKLSDDGRLEFHIPLTFSTDVKPRTEGATLGLDWGLNSVLTTSDGRLLGRSLFEWLSQRDAELMDLQKSLQQQGIPLKSSKRFRALTRRVREHVKNEIGRLFNQIASLPVKTVVVEELDFRFGGLSARLNRLVSRAGRSVVKNKLADLTEIHGVSVETVRPEYTSQRCFSCGLVDKRSRRGETFSCTHCGRIVHSDVNAARNIVHRSGWKDFPTHTSKQDCLRVLDQDYCSRWNDDPSRARKRKAGPKPCHAHTAGLHGISLHNVTGNCVVASAT